ncbi:N-acetylneuraminate synthase family protein [Segetibacter sp.]|jgi:N-acetylneuraminate synthase|uniref:N-acetylneuraminate synthase family protein n=1 Tax=Segetibacter sp. TaxID=2231182 RepID=UPI002632A3B7|nr:N-acetylneuraminate synthase family protein [Segetibacter sp.]MCW3081365.1 N-acetylneuraminate synthase [Segetibacter sp.]
MIIAEIGQAHDGSVGILHSYIAALASTGIDAIKFQTHIAEAESSSFETFRIPFSYVDKTRFDYWTRMQLSTAQWTEVKEHCHKVGLEFISSPFSCKAVDVLEEAGVDRYKIGSGEVTNFLMLEKIAATGKPVILSSGMSTLEELDAAVHIFKEKEVELAIMQCTTAYPTQPEQWGLHIIKQLNDRYNIATGLSDHSGDITACLAATAVGAEILEFHVVFDKRMFGPDAKASIEIDEVERLVKGVKQIRASLENRFCKNALAENMSGLKQLFGKSLCINKTLPQGHTVTFEDLESKKPSGFGIAPSDYKSIIGKRLNKALSQWEFLNHEDFSTYD